MHEFFMSSCYELILQQVVYVFVCVCAHYLRMLTSSLVTKELLSAAEACCFFRDSSSSSTWDRQRRKWAWCTNIIPPLAVCLAQTFWLQINPEDSTPECWYLFERDLQTNRYILYTPLVCGLVSHFTMSQSFSPPSTCFESVCVLVSSSLISLSCLQLSLISICTPIFLFFFFLTASVCLAAQPHSQASQDG